MFNIKTLKSAQNGLKLKIESFEGLGKVGISV
jgi:hypothetical protein